MFNLIGVKTTPTSASDAEQFRILSSISDDVWHGARSPQSYEWWYFDAVSDDGRDLLVIIFLANFVFSPRYNRNANELRNETRHTHEAPFAPALAVTWYRDGRVLLRSLGEHTASDFAASADVPACRIGMSNFRFEPAANGGNYRVELNTTLRGGRTLAAALDWRIAEGDLPGASRTAHTDAEAYPHAPGAAHEWNMVAPRCDVSGKLTITESRGAGRTHEFRGTGYHDHNRDDRFLPATIADWQWGRAHFKSATAVFYRFRERHAAPATRLLIIPRDSNDMAIYNARCRATSLRRHHFGLRYPRRLEFTTAESSPDHAVTLAILQERIVDGSFFYLRMTGRAALDRRDGSEPEEALLISERLAPHALRWRWLDWLIDMRISRNNRPSFLP